METSQSADREVVEVLQRAGLEWWRAGREIFEKSQKVSFIRDSFDVFVNSFGTPCRFLDTIGLELLKPCFLL